MTNETEVDKAKALLASLSQGTQFAEPPTLDLDALIAAAREVNGLHKIDEKKKTLEAPDPQLANTLLAQAEDLKRTIDAATKERAKITDFFGELIEKAEANPGDIEELTVNGATIFTSKVSTSRVLNQSHVKSIFPDIAENAEMWSEQTTRRRLYK